MAGIDLRGRMNRAVQTLDGRDGFAAFVDDLARNLVDHSPTFESFVAALPGVLPDEALAALRRIGGPNAEKLAADAATDRAGPLIDQCAQLPLPHPIDSEFRFDAATARILARAVVEATKNGDEVLLIGVPSVAIELAAMDVDRRVRFLGPDNCVTDAVRAAFENKQLVLDQGPGRTAAAALLDPPWYVDPMVELIEVCAHGCRDGAIVTLTVPELGTRPKIVADRAAYLATAAQAGLRPTGGSGPVCYRTPLFELAALERQGIGRLASWRRGEALEFVVTASRPSREWVRPRATELSVFGTRLRLTTATGPGGSGLEAVHSHEVFPSVSSRAPGRSRATLWTTTNRAFAVNPRLTRHALSKMAEQAKDEVLHLRISEPQNELVSTSCVAAAEELIHQLTELVGRELHDARRLVGDGAWLMTGMDWRS
jgi:hypothetical protein